MFGLSLGWKTIDESVHFEPDQVDKTACIWALFPNRCKLAETR